MGLSAPWDFPLHGIDPPGRRRGAGQTFRSMGSILPNEITHTAQWAMLGFSKFTGRYLAEYPDYGTRPSSAPELHDTPIGQVHPTGPLAVERDGVVVHAPLSLDNIADRYRLEATKIFRARGSQ